MSPVATRVAADHARDTAVAHHASAAHAAAHAAAAAATQVVSHVRVQAYEGQQGALRREPRVPVNGRLQVVTAAGTTVENF